MRAPFFLFGGGHDHQEELINDIYQLSKTIESQDAQIGNHTDTSGSNVNLNNSYRSSRIKWLTPYKWVGEELYSRYILPANRDVFGVNVTPYCTVQYTEYHASERGKYDWHMDVFWGESKPFDRKLSLTLQLSDPHEYEGGDFEFENAPLPENAKTKGSVIVFPSYLMHRVTPVTKGVRKTLVAWFEGPRWV